MKNKKTHSTQRKYFGTIPRSEFYGFVLGYALGLIISGLLRLDSQFQYILFALVGFGIGYYIDKKYYQEPDEPDEPESSGELGNIGEAGSTVEQTRPADGTTGEIPEETPLNPPVIAGNTSTGAVPAEKEED